MVGLAGYDVLTAEDGRAALAIALACARSAKTGAAVRPDYGTRTGMRRIRSQASKPSRLIRASPSADSPSSDGASTPL